MNQSALYKQRLRAGARCAAGDRWLCFILRKLLQNRVSRPWGRVRRLKQHVF